MHRPHASLFAFICFAASLSGCAVAVDDSGPTPEPPPALIETHGAVPLPHEEAAPTELGWDLADLLSAAKAAVGTEGERGAVVPATVLNPTSDLGAPCMQCMQVPAERAMPRPRIGTH